MEEPGQLNNDKELDTSSSKTFTCRFSVEEIDSIFANLREEQVKGMEAEFFSGSDNSSFDDNESSATNAPKVLLNFDVDSDNEINTRIHELYESASQVSEQVLQFNGAHDGSIESESILTMNRPERYRLAYLPWITSHSITSSCHNLKQQRKQNQSNVVKERLIKIDEQLIVHKRMGQVGQTIFVGWIEIKNNCSDSLISYNIKDYNSSIFYVRAPTGILKPLETHKILVSTSAAVPFKIIDLTNETFTIYAAPCKIVDLYCQPAFDTNCSSTEENQDSTSAPDGTGDLQMGHKDLTTKINELHLADFWSSYGSPWFPSAQILTIKKILPPKKQWLNEESLLKSVMKDVYKYTLVTGTMNALSMIKQSWKDIFFPTSTFKNYGPTGYSSGFEPFLQIPESRSKLNKSTFSQLIQEPVMKRKIIKSAACVVILYLFACSEFSPYAAFSEKNMIDCFQVCNLAKLFDLGYWLQL